MEIERGRFDEGIEWRILGRLDGYWASHLETELAEAVRSGERHICLNLSGMTFLSSAGIRILLMYWKELKSVGGVLQVTEPSDIVNQVLEMSGLKGLMEGGDASKKPATESAEEKLHIEFGGLSAQVFKLSDSEPMSCRTVGPSNLFSGTQAVSSETVSLTEDTFAVGIGAFGQKFDDCRHRFGELLAAAGTGVHLPTDTSGAPDYLIGAESYVPVTQLLSGLVFEGRFSRFLKFSPSASDAPIPFSVIVDAALQTVSSHSVGMVVIAEIEGLLGASLKRSPASETPAFDFPGIRDWIAYAQDLQYERSLALVAGVACADSGGEFSGFLRPLRPDGKILGHFHAVVVPYRLLPGGVLKPSGIIPTLFEGGSVQTVLHLLRDDRPGAGAGESLFSHGVAWVGSIAPPNGAVSDTEVVS